MIRQEFEFCYNFLNADSSRLSVSYRLTRALPCYRARRHNSYFHSAPRFFNFYIFNFCFLQKIYFRYENLQKYTPAAPLPGGRDLAALQGLIRKKKTTKNCRQVPGDRSPGSGAAGPIGRPAAGRPAHHPYIRCWLPLPPHLPY